MAASAVVSAANGYPFESALAAVGGLVGRFPWTAADALVGISAGQPGGWPGEGALQRSPDRGWLSERDTHLLAISIVVFTWPACHSRPCGRRRSTRRLRGSGMPAPYTSTVAASFTTGFWWSWASTLSGTGSSVSTIASASTGPSGRRPTRRPALLAMPTWTCNGFFSRSDCEHRNRTRWSQSGRGKPDGFGSNLRRRSGGTSPGMNCEGSVGGFGYDYERLTQLPSESRFLDARYPQAFHTRSNMGFRIFPGGVPKSSTTVSGSMSVSTSIACPTSNP